MIFKGCLAGTGYDFDFAEEVLGLDVWDVSWRAASDVESLSVPGFDPFVAQK